MIIQVVGCKGPEPTRERVEQVLWLLKNYCKDEVEVEMTGGGITTGDVMGYCTYVIEVPDGTPQKQVDRIGACLAMTCIGKYSSDQGGLKAHKLPQWYWAAANMGTVELSL